MIFYEPVTWGMIFDGNVLGSGFTEVPGGTADKDLSVLSYHYYCGMFGGDKKVCDEIVGPQIMSTVLKDVAGLGGSTFMTEFGSCGKDLSQCVGAMDLADQFLQSWMLWPGTQVVEGKDHHEHGKIDKSYQEILARTYARAIAGTPECMKFDSETGEFILRFRIDTSISQPTEIFAPIDRIYQGGIAVETSAGLRATVDTANNLIRVVPTDQAADDEKGWVRATRKTTAINTPITCQAPAQGR